MKKSFVLGLVLINVLLQAQDTIYKLNGELLLVKVTTALPKVIVFKYRDRIDGPNNVLLKKEIKEIRYMNGVIEEYNGSDNPTILRMANIGNVPVFTHYDRLFIPSYYNRGRFIHMGQVVSDKILYEEAENLNWSLQNKELTLAINYYKSRKRKQYAYGYLSLGISGGLLAGALFSLLFDNKEAATGFTISLPVVFFTGQTMSFINKRKSLKSSVELAKIYNQNL